MPKPHRLRDGRHAEKADGPAGIANGEMPGICRKLDRPDARPKKVISLFRRGVGWPRPRLENVAIGGVKENPVTVGCRVPHSQPSPVGAPSQPLGIERVGRPGSLQFSCRIAVYAHHVLTRGSCQQRQVTCLGPEGEAFGRCRGREDLGAGNLGRLGRREVEHGELETEGGDDADLAVRCTEANIRGLRAGSAMIPDGGTEPVVHCRHDTKLLGVGDKQEARRGRPLEAEDGACKVLAQLDDVDHAEPGDGSDVDDGSEDGRNVFPVRAREGVRRSCGLSTPVPNQSLTNPRCSHFTGWEKCIVEWEPAGSRARCRLGKQV